MVKAMGHQNSSGQKAALAVAISGQAFYAVVPMTLALSLNSAMGLKMRQWGSKCGNGAQNAAMGLVEAELSDR
jgi:hypothetical protein